MHYAAALQGTTNGLNQLYNTLVEIGADENVVDVVICRFVLSLHLKVLPLLSLESGSARANGRQGSISLGPIELVVWIIITLTSKLPVPNQSNGTSMMQSYLPSALTLPAGVNCFISQM